MIELKHLKEIIEYHPITGLWTWKIYRGGKTVPGTIAGTLNSEGYNQIGIEGRLYLSNRLAWFYMTGKWPTDLIDHQNTIRDDDRWINLREATNRENIMNSRRSYKKKSGLPKGVTWNARLKKYQARIKIHYKGIHLGYFLTPEEASDCYFEAAKKQVGNFARRS